VVTRDGIEVRVHGGAVQAAAAIPATDAIADVRLAAALAMQVDTLGRWAVVDTSAWVPVRAALRGGERAELPPLRLTMPRPRGAPLAAFWLVFALEGTAPHTSFRPGARFTTFVPGRTGMFAGFR
jgi:hypothetical protein